MNKKIVFGILLASVFAFVVFFHKNRNTVTTTENNKEKVESTLSLNIDYGDGNVVNFEKESKEGSTAFSLLKVISEENSIPLITQQYDFGVFVKSINQLESGTDLSWVYFVNGLSGDVAADQKILQPGDLVEWKYIKPEM